MAKKSNQKIKLLYLMQNEKRKGKSVTYHVISREFELPELKLLVDAVQSSRFITHKKSNELIKKIEGFASRYEAQELQRQVFVSNRIKAMNESIYYPGTTESRRSCATTAKYIVSARGR